jgi:putative membrane protein insertion efficiency factor
MCEDCSGRDVEAVRPPRKTSVVGRNFAGPWRRTPGRLLGTGLVRFYQLTFSGFVGGHCRHLPTCSEYGYEAIARHGLVHGGWLTAKRVARCGPFGKAGIDPVPPVRDRA